ncbi:MAG: type II toxin-antitoxin system HipA family toxin [Betaproteobacteria bacterium]|nr:type II toxin-antitoxin system HipA family toxin [Betaproteobacteria bacterium]
MLPARLANACVRAKPPPSAVPAKGDAFNVARAETCTSEPARRCGLTVPEARHLDLGGRPVMLIRRFDRNWPGLIMPSRIRDASPGAWGLCFSHLPPGHRDSQRPAAAGRQRLQRR